MRTRLFIILFLCLPLCVLADNGYDDIGDFFKFCSTAKSPGLRHTYVSKLMMKRVSSLPAGEFDLKPIYDKIDFIQSVYVMPGSEKGEVCLQKVDNLPEEAVESGFKCVFSLNKEGQQSQIFIKSGEGGLNSMLMINVCHSPDGEFEYAVVALIGGVFSHDEILSLMNF